MPPLNSLFRAAPSPPSPNIAMEARLLQARKLPNQYGVEEWQLIDPERRGIEVTRANLHKDTNLMSIDPDAMSFLINLAGDGGPWAGWRLHAVGELKDTTEGIPYFDFVLLQTKDSMPKGVDGGTQTSLAKSAPPDSKEDLLEGGYDLVSQHAGSL